jgi:hypothetical protein
MSNTNTKIFSEAIAEAKSIRETAMVNAKLALEEAFAPRMQEMMSSRLEALSEENEEVEEAFKKSNGEMPGDESMEEISLEELLAELEALEEDDNVDYTMGSDDENQLPNPASELTINEEAEDDDTVGEITVDDLKDIIRDVVADLMGGESEEEEAGEEEEMTGEEEAGEDEFNLEEILAELDSLNENEEVEEAMQEPSDSAAAGAAELERMIKALAAKMGTSFDAAYDKIGNIIHGGKSLGVREVAQENEELEEAMSTISTLRSELNEVNLLNAKLLYVNKLFKSKNLTEAQKVKVINAFDRAETVKETKNIFETLQESLNVTPAKNSIKESLSYASKAAGVAPNRQPIVENNDFVARMQKLAGII